MRIEPHQAVIDKDLPGIYAHIARDNQTAAERLLEAVAVTFSQIQMQPEIGALYLTRNPQMKSVRMLPVCGFNLFWSFIESKRIPCVSFM